jgi:hypothetical protein
VLTYRFELVRRRSVDEAGKDADATACGSDRRSGAGIRVTHQRRAVVGTSTRTRTWKSASGRLWRLLEGWVCASLPNSSVSIRARCSGSAALSKAAQARSSCSPIGRGRAAAALNERGIPRHGAKTRGQRCRSLARCARLASPGAGDGVEGENNEPLPRPIETIPSYAQRPHLLPLHLLKRGCSCHSRSRCLCP